jgi:hypothetical protein
VTATRLLPLLRDIGLAGALTPAQWDDTVRLARQSRLLGLVAHRLRDRDELWRALLPAVRGHLQAAIHYSAHRAQMVRMELDAIDAALATGRRVVILKGAAYLMRGLEFARGRIPNDVDLMVPRTELDEAEAALKAAGWESATDDAYDQRYYREWSHELPPMRFPGHALEIDLHHTISPVTSRIRVDDALMFEGVRDLAGTGRFAVLHPCDQIIHAAIHLFQDSELSNRLRDLVDIDGLIRSAMCDAADWRELLRRSERHGIGDVLWYALHYCRTWLGTPVPPDVAPRPPPAWRRHLLDGIFHRASLPGLPDAGGGFAHGLALRLGTLRYHWLRMPPGLLVRHGLTKAWRAVGGRAATE